MEARVEKRGVKRRVVGGAREVMEKRMPLLKDGQIQGAVFWKISGNRAIPSHVNNGVKMTVIAGAPLWELLRQVVERYDIRRAHDKPYRSRRCLLEAKWGTTSRTQATIFPRAGVRLDGRGAEI